MRAILQELIGAIETDHEVVYCAVVATRGSTPQKAGAAMLVYPDGRQTGTLGGGCVEAEVKQRALRALTDKDTESPDPMILSFTLDHDYGWDDGLICGGRMEMLIEPGHREGLAYYRRFSELVESGQGCLEAVVIDPEQSALGGPAGARFLLDAQGQFVATHHAPTPPNGTLEEVGPVAERYRPWCRRGVAYLPVRPQSRLVIVGAGHVGQAVAPLAHQADFDIWVIDDRQAYANRQRFPQAEQILVGPIGPTLESLEVTPYTYCLIVTRGHAHDEEALYHLAQKGARYVGLIGSKRKIRLILEDLIAQGVSAEVLEKVHAPVGLDIGSQTVPEIAVSIVAELIAHRNLGYSPKRLRIARGSSSRG